MKMPKLIITAALFCMLTITTVSQDDCGLDQLDIQNQLLLFSVSTDTERQLWRHSFAENSSTYTGVSIPDDAAQLVLSPDSSRLAYRLIDYGTLNPDDDVLKVNVLDINTGDDAEVFAGTNPDTPQLIDLRWIDNNRLGFISNGREQQYTIVDVETGDSIMHRAGIPIPERDTVGESIWGDWDIAFSPLFSRAAFVDLWEFDIITFWDLETGSLVKTDVEFPVGWVYPSRPYKWADEDHFLIRNDEWNWLEFSVEADTVRQLTDVGEIYRLHAPVVSWDGTSIAFIVYHKDSNNFDTSLAVWNNGELIKSCLNEQTGQYLRSRNGWDNSSRYFAFTVFEYAAERHPPYVYNDTSIYVFDTETAALSKIYSLSQTDSTTEAIGWIEAD
jgi:hypothetical protein